MAPRKYSRKFRGFISLFTVLVLFLVLARCSPRNRRRKAKSARPLAGVKLRLVVVDDPAIATAVRGLKDEWNAQTGSEIEVVESTEKQIADAGPLPGDAVICPAYLLGPLAEAKRLAPVPRSIARDPQGPWSQTFELLRNQEAVWGNEVYGVPLGSPVFCCYYRADLLEKLHRKPPRTWKEYEELARLLREEGAKSGESSTARSSRWPAAGRGSCSWPGPRLTPKSATTTRRSSMKKRWNRPSPGRPSCGPWRNWSRPPSSDRPSSSISIRPPPGPSSGKATRRWPSVGQRGAKPSPPALSQTSYRRRQRGESPPAGFAELPGATEVYQSSSKSWEPRSDDAGQRVPLLGVAGRMGVVRAESEHTDAAFEFLLWLTDPQWASQVFAASPATTLFRRAQVASPKAWVESDVSATAAQAIRRADRGNALAAAVPRLAPHARPGRLPGGPR